MVLAPQEPSKWRPPQVRTGTETAGSGSGATAGLAAADIVTADSRRSALRTRHIAVKTILFQLQHLRLEEAGRDPLSEVPVEEMAAVASPTLSSKSVPSAPPSNAGLSPAMELGSFSGAGAPPSMIPGEERGRGNAERARRVRAIE